MADGNASGPQVSSDVMHTSYGEAMNKTSINFYFSILCLFAPLFFIGCASTQYYKAPDLPLEQMAVLKTHNNKHTSLVSIDGKPTTAFLNYMVAGGFKNNIAVTPGKHIIKVSYLDDYSRGWGTFELITLPGKISI